MIGNHIQQYAITTQLGEGGMGKVYLAEDQLLQRKVAVKVLHHIMTGQPQVLERFRKEAQVLARLLHPNIAVIYNLAEQQGEHYMIMEYVEGKTLETLLKEQGTIAPVAATAVFLQALDGLQHAHRKGIFHRDLKPSNIMLTPEGFVKLMDFGIAKVAGEQRLTQVNRVIGTIEYLAPELVEGRDPSAASDIYAMGMTLYEMVCGKLPFTATTDFHLMQEIMKAKISTPEKINPGIPRPLAAVIMTSLAKKPEDRYPDARAFQQALANAMPAAIQLDLAGYYAPVSVPLNASDSTIVSARSTPQWRKALQQTDRRIWIALACIVVVTVALQLLVSDEAPAVPPKKNEWTPTLSRKPVPAAFSAAPVQLVSAPVQQALTPKPTGVGTTDDDGLPSIAELEKKILKKKKTPVVKPEQLPATTVVETIKEEPPAEPENRSTGGRLLKLPKLEVDLYLQDVVDLSTAYAGQPLRFTVSSPVVFDGTTVVKKGSTVSGHIKAVNKRRVSVVIHTVTATDGQEMAFYDREINKRPDDFNSDRYYTGILRRGLILLAK